MTKVSIRNIDPDIYYDARVFAVQTGQTMGEIISFALENLIADHDECELVDEPTW